MTTLMSNDAGCTYLGNSNKPCGAKTVAGKSYCEHHLWMVYQKGTAVHRRKDIKTANAVWDLESEMNAAIEELVEEGFDL